MFFGVSDASMVSEEFSRVIQRSCKILLDGLCIERAPAVEPAPHLRQRLASQSNWRARCPSCGSFFFFSCSLGLRA